MLVEEIRYIFVSSSFILQCTLLFVQLYKIAENRLARKS